MLSYEDALAIILDSIRTLPQKRLPLDKLLGSVTAEPIVAHYDLPHFDNSAVDGYGIHITDLEQLSQSATLTLSVQNEIRAGDNSAAVLVPGFACKIFTGAAIPHGVEAVIMREFCQEEDEKVTLKKAVSIGENIRRRGEEFLRGQQILPEGVRITPPVIGLLASLGQASFVVSKKPTVAVISTGNELVKPGKHLEAGQIYDSNSFALRAALESLGVDDFLPLHCREDLNETRKTLKLAMDFADIIITAGGVSVGDHDYVKQVFEELGVKTLVYKVAIKPGKPVYFGCAERRRGGSRQYIFGLPGNPVSALATFHQFVKPALLKLSGQTSKSINPPSQVTAKLTKKMRKTAGRLEFVRAVLEKTEQSLVVTPAVGQGSHMLGGLCQANGLIVFPADKEKLEEGEMVVVNILSWSC
ncbi:MAG: molybdopterin molybdotransferase MoeA [Candidatus Obscuribacterales bacterium]|nr:molybdopterin molybdotransferase MoeA [Candidatus Obscuribacterales bacterium]